MLLQIACLRDDELGRVRKRLGQMTENSFDRAPKPSGIVLCCLAIVVALIFGVGMPDRLVLRHVVQTLPLWVPTVLGLRGSRTSSWTSLPLFIFWFALMVLIWLYLLGISHLIDGHFTALEIAMTIVVGVSSATGIYLCLVSGRNGLRATKAFCLFAGFAILQCACLLASLLPAIAHR